MPLLGEDVEAIRAVLDQYPNLFEARWHALFAAKLGFATKQLVGIEFIQQTLQLLQTHAVDFTRFFRDLSLLDEQPTLVNGSAHPDAKVRDLFLDRSAFDTWAVSWRQLLNQQNLLPNERRTLQNRHNPNVVLRNHLAQKAIDDANQGDFSEVERLFTALSNPYESNDHHIAYIGLPPEWSKHLEVSCSS